MFYKLHLVFIMIKDITIDDIVPYGSVYIFLLEITIQ